jgi:hypothetical protein
MVGKHRPLQVAVTLPPGETVSGVELRLADGHVVTAKVLLTARRTSVLLENRRSW